ncbi:MAG: UDP-2-acetamido-2-deoxy-3-oxo-D-glucuronate aminotransferase [Verrucomicrobia subdivision 3 bacterium]|nr:UDP-2-acetamido-2-deoxy-3-oxo-D-glucuronate aminotransferase [Limisphaerales bacterium]MCS1415856.1 UDP-2-acetamido-2-deoxy-3-oxo-D-glucuronate aminotransferase [Limisphaerales bacterium]
MEFIDFKSQYQKYQEPIDRAISKVLTHGKFIMGPEVVELEDQLADFTGVCHCLTVASGTDSLEIALRALEIGPGDEVITVPFTWISTAEVIELVGAKTIFVDIDPKTFNMDMTQLEGAITSVTKAIIPVSLFGQIPNLEEANRIAALHDIAVIEDGAQSFGATRVGRRSGSLTTIGSTSFFPAKPFGCYGDGGALFTNDNQLGEKMRRIRTHGSERHHHHTTVGMNGRFDTVQAAILLAKWPFFMDELEKREVIGRRYSEFLDNICTVPRVDDKNSHVYGQYTIRVKNRNQVQRDLRDKGIPTAIYYPKCLHEQPVFSKLGYTLGDFPAAEAASREVLSLPIHPFLNEVDQDRVIKGLHSLLTT